jgi:5-methylcytosine-specific restriction endonuclease McrA
MESGYAFDGDRFYLGSLCKRGHDWRSTGQSLRRRESNKSAGGNCLECEQVRLLGNPTALAARREYAREYMRKHRAECGRLSRSKRALPGESKDVAAARLAAERAICEAIRAAGRSPSVARLVMNEQRRYWQVNPEAKAAHDRWWDKYKYSWRYKCDPLFRLHECQRNSEKKARNRGNHTVRISKKEIQARYAEFDHQCAFCGSDDRIVIEHVVPRSKGGPHALGNILPACHRCNTNKTNHEVETWYRRQPFFSELRWRKICRVLGWQRSSVGQLALL